MMYTLLPCNLLSLVFSQLVVSEGIQRRQNDSPSSISVPSFTYGYYSQVYPNGEVTSSVSSNTHRAIDTGATSSTKADITQSRGTPAADVGVGSSPGGQSGNSGSMGAAQEEAFIASMCQPVNRTNQPDMDFPCNKILLYEFPCIYGQSYQELLQSSDSAAPSTHDPNDQQKCFCAMMVQAHSIGRTLFSK